MAFKKPTTPLWFRKILYFFLNLLPGPNHVPIEETQEWVDKKEEDSGIDSEIDGKG